ncbi:unnamed protein product [Penicillium olsonii]|nr:unnamed protein product [Penicillium olsonii]
MSKKAADKIFPIKTFISDIPANSFQSASPENGHGRLVIVGDVHGMRGSLEALLEKVSFNKENGDHLILVGDLVNKGPDSPGVIDLAMKLGASAVRGNHDNAVLNAAREIQAAKENTSPVGGLGIVDSPKKSEASPPVHTVHNPDVPEKATSPKYDTARALSKMQMDWIAALPLVLRIKLPHHASSSLGDQLVVVHAGLAPGVPLEDQDPHAVMHMRSLVRAGDEASISPTEAPGDESWVREWDQYQEGLASKSTVVFGHDAKRRLQLGKYAIGLDSGCLYGNQLSAAVIKISDGVITHDVISVECADPHLVV